MTDVILTPEQRVRVFISSTLEELTAERAAARRAIRRLNLVPVSFKSGARPHPPRGMYRADLEHARYRGHLLAAVQLGGAGDRGDLGVGG